MNRNLTSKKSDEADVATLDTGKRTDDKLLDEAIAETFPASDPISPAYQQSMDAVSLDQEEAAAKAARLQKLKRAAPYLVAGAAGVALAVSLLTRPRHRPMIEQVGDVARRWADRVKDSEYADTVTDTARKVGDQAQTTTEHVVEALRGWLRR